MPKHHKPSPARGYLARNVRYARNTKRWSQEELAARASVHRNIIGAIERAETAPTVDTVFAIGKAFGVDCYLLLMAPAEAQPRLLALIDKA